jgi:hypothetical protein
MTTKIAEANIKQETLDNLGSGPLIANVQIANSSYTVLDDTAVSLDGGYIILNGSKFESNVNVLINNIPATSVVYVSETQVRAQIPASTAGSKHVYIVNTDTGATAIRVNGLTYSGVPSWNTDSSLGEGILDEPIIISLSATADSNVSYQLQTGSSLPTGLSLAANGLLSGTVTGLEEETLYNFTIEAIDEENQESPRAFSVTIILGDEYFNQTVLLLKGDGTNGAQNNTFLDSSTNNFTITRNGNTTQGTFSPFSAPDGRWSNYFDGNRAYFTLASNSDFAFGTGAYTVEAWVYQTAYDSASSIIFSSASASGGFNLGIAPNGSLGISKYGTGGVVNGNAGDIPLNTWCHIAAVRTSTASNDTRLYVNGTLIKTGTDSNDWTVSSSPSIGAFTNLSTYDYFGYISNLSVVKGTAITPSAGGPTSPLSTSTTNQKLLTCYGNRFADFNTATTAKAITVNGTIKATPFSPFAPTAAYDASVNGGSVYGNASTAYLSFTDTSNDLDLGGRQASLEVWYYPTSLGAYQNILVKYGGATSWTASNSIEYAISLNSGVLTLNYNNGTASPTTITDPTTRAAGQWLHLAVATDASNNIGLYVNGVRVNTGSNAITKPATRTTILIGSANSQFIVGYLSQFKFNTGADAIDPTDTTITIPSAPSTADINTELLLLGTNAGIFDNTGKNNLETVGNAQIDTTTKKFGSGAMYFDGTGDALILPSSENLILNGNFTIEGWLYLTSGTTYYTLLATSAWGANNGGLMILQSHPSYTGKLSLWLANNASGASPLLVGATSLSATTWTHFAVTRSGNDFKLFVNGVQDDSDSSSAAISLAITQIATLNSSNNFNGYIDDLRITKGVARTITLPTKAFPVR